MYYIVNTCILLPATQFLVFNKNHNLSFFEKFKIKILIHFSTRFRNVKIVQNIKLSIQYYYFVYSSGYNKIFQY